MSVRLGNVVLEVTPDLSKMRHLSPATGELGKYSTGVRSAEEHSSRLSSTTSKLRSTLGTAAKAAAGAAIAYVGLSQVKAAISTTQELAKSTLTLNKNLGLSVKVSSEWAAVAKARDIDTNKLGMSFKTLATQVEAARSGSATAKATFDSLGISTKDLNEGAKNLEPLILKIADGMGNLGAGTERTTVSSHLFGRGWATIVPLMRDGSVELQKNLDVTEKYGATLNNKTLKAQSDLISAQRETKIAWEGLQLQLGTALTPALEEANKQFQTIAKTMADPDLSDAEKFQKISGVIEDDLSKALNFVVDEIPQIADRVGEEAPKVASGLVHGFLDANVWGKVALGGFLITKLGLGSAAMRGIGVTAGTQVGAGMATGLTGTGAAGSSFAPATGFRNRFTGALKTVGWAAAGAAVIGGLFTAISEHKDIGVGATGDLNDFFVGVGKTFGVDLGKTTGEVFADQLQDSFDHAAQGLNLGAQAEAFFGRDFARSAGAGLPMLQILGLEPGGPTNANLAEAAKATAKGYRVEFHKQTLEGFFTQSQIEQMTPDQRKLADQLVDAENAAGRLASKHAINLSSLVKIDPGEADALATQLNKGLNSLRSGALANWRDIRSVYKKNLAAIKSSPDLNGKETHQAMARNFMATADAVKVAMARGEISTDKGMAKITRLIRKADLAGGLHSKQFGEKFADMFGHAGKVTNDGMDHVISQLKRMPPAARETAEAAMLAQVRELVKGGKLSSEQARQIRSGIVAQLGPIKDDSSKLFGSVSDLIDSNLSKAAQEGSDSSAKLRKNIGDDSGKIKDATGSMADKTKDDFHSFSDTAIGVLRKVSDATVAQLKKWGVSTADFSASSDGGGKGGPGKAFGGPIRIPGQGLGDRVPVEVDGRMVALTEPGEDLFILNRSASAEKRNLEAWNAGVPRRAQGGIVPGPTAGVHSAVLNYVSSLYGRYGGSVSSGLRPTDSDSLHSTGQALDYVPSDWAGAAKAVNADGPSLLEGIYDPDTHGGPPVSWDTGHSVPYPSFWGLGTWLEHLTHIHIAIADGTKVAAAAAATLKKIKRYVWDGPDGAVKGIGQAQSDKAVDAANAYLRKHMPQPVGGQITGGTPGKPVKSLPQSLEKYNRTYPSAVFPSTAWTNLFQIPFDKVAELAEWAGGGAVPGVTMAQVSIGEGDLKPGSESTDGGFGMWGYTPSAAGIVLGHSGPDVHNPIIDAQVMAAMYRANPSGVPPSSQVWHGIGAVTDSSAHYTGKMLAKGGILKLAGGGGGLAPPASGQHHYPGQTGGNVAPVSGQGHAPWPQHALNQHDRLRGLIARLRERIDLTTREAALPGSPGGTEMTEDERQKIRGLDYDLLHSLRHDRDAIERIQHAFKIRHKRGFRIPNFGQRMQKLNQELVEEQGLTGRGGTIFDTVEAITGLAKVPPGGVDLSAQVAATQQFFDFIRLVGPTGLPSFDLGGVVRGPIGRPQAAILHGGEEVITAAERSQPAAAPEVHLHFAPGMEWLREFIQVEYRNCKTAEQVKARAGLARGR